MQDGTTEKCEGWAYFENPDIRNIEEGESPTKSEQTPSQILELCKKEMEESFAQAVLDPTEGNIFQYLELQDRWLRRSSQVAKVWAKVVLESPELNNALNGMPTSSYGTKYYHQLKSLQQREVIQGLSETHSLICFYKGNDPASKELAKVLKLFSKKHNWLIQPISVDGMVLNEMVNSTVDKGLTEQLGVSYYPSIYVFDPTEYSAKPVGFGLVSVDMLEVNISLQYQNSSG